MNYRIFLHREERKKEENICLRFILDKEKKKRTFLIPIKNNMVLFTLIVVLVFLTVLFYYLKRVYFTLYGPIPGIPPQFLVGNLLQTGVIGRNVPFNLIFLELKTKFGDIFQYWVGPTRLILINNLEDVQHIFNHRNIYDQGDIFIDKISLINPYAILCQRGLNK
jgi:hypothetical protein